MLKFMLSMGQIRHLLLEGNFFHQLTMHIDNKYLPEKHDTTLLTRINIINIINI